MTSLVPVHQVFGTGAPVKKRNVWSGADRRVRAIVGGRKDVFRLRPKGNGISGYSSMAHNGVDAYVVAYGASIFSSPDLLTGTARSLSGTAASAGQLLNFGGTFFYCFPVAGPSLAINRSADKGVTWATVPSLGGGQMSVVNGILYSVVQPIASPIAQSTFYTLSDPAGVATARAFSRASYWGKVVGNATRQYCFASAAAGSHWTLCDVSTNGTSFAQDTGYEALAGRAPMNMRNACSLADGRVMVFGVSTAGLFSLVADAAGVWSVGAQIPGELGDGYRLHSVGTVHSYFIGPAAYTDADGITHVLLMVQDGFGNYLARVACTYDGVDWWFLPPHSNFGTSAPTMYLGVFSNIAGLPVANYSDTQLVEANPNGTELYYEV